MGGDHHGHGPPKVPDWRIYKTENVPELARVQRLLAIKGLKDPWLRNEVWRFNPAYGTIHSNLKGFFTRGLKYGFIAFVATVAIETALGIDYHGGHGDDHDKNHH